MRSFLLTPTAQSFRIFSLSTESRELAFLNEWCGIWSHNATFFISVKQQINLFSKFGKKSQ
nr:MAG TPA: hypothetical protein [Bacteriophage sp.]